MKGIFSPDEGDEAQRSLVIFSNCLSSKWQSWISVRQSWISDISDRAKYQSWRTELPNPCSVHPLDFLPSELWQHPNLPTLVCQPEIFFNYHKNHIMLGCLGVFNSLQPRGLQLTRLLCPWDFPGKNTGVGCHFLVLEIFLTQGLNLHLLHWQADSLLLSYRGSLKNVCSTLFKVNEQKTLSHDWEKCELKGKDSEERRWMPSFPAREASIPCCWGLWSENRTLSRDWGSLGTKRKSKQEGRLEMRV